jgi:hypothetical protein
MIRYLLATSLICFLSITNAWALAGSAALGSLQTNPSANAVLVTSSALSSGTTTGASYVLDVVCSGSVAFTCEFQVMNGSTAVSSIYFQVPAGQTFNFNSAPISFQIPNGYTLRVITPTSVTGTVQASIFYANDGGY